MSLFGFMASLKSEKVKGLSVGSPTSSPLLSVSLLKEFFDVLLLDNDTKGVTLTLLKSTSWVAD